MKKCPYCAEEIQDDAVKCRFCGELFKKQRGKNCLFSCLIAFLLSFLLTGLFLYLGSLIVRHILYKIFYADPNLQPYTCPYTWRGIEDMLRSLFEGFNNFLQRFRDFLHSQGQNYNQVTF